MRPSRRGRRRLLALAVCAALAGTAWMSFASSRHAARESRLAEARAEGLEMHRARDYAGALTTLSHYLSRRQNDVEALLAFADARVRVPTENGRHVLEAIGLYNAALQIEPDNVLAMERLMLLYERTGRRVEWLAIAERMLTLDPEHVEALRLSALACYFDLRYEDAARHAERLIHIEPDEVQWRELYLQMLREQGVPMRELLNVCERWISVHEGDGRFHLVEAKLLLAAGRYDAARRAASEAADRGADSPEVLQQMVSMLEAIGLREAATAVLSRAAARHGHESWVHEVAVRRSWQIGELDDALMVIERLEERGPLSASLLRWKSVLLLLQHRFDEAGRVAEQLASTARRGDDEATDRDRAWSRAVQARLRQEQTGWRNVVDEYQRALALAPGDVVLHFLRAEAYALMGEHDLAAMSLERAVQFDPYWVVAQARYAEALLRVGKHERAARLALGVLRRSDEPDFALCLVFARAWLASGLTAADLGFAAGADGGERDVLRFLHALFEQAPDHPEVTEMLVRAQLLDGRTSPAIELIERIVADDGAGEGLLISLAAMSEQRGLGLEERIFENARERYGLTLPLAVIEARRLHNLGRTVEAVELLRSVDVAESTERDREIADFLAWAGHPAAAAALRGMLDAAGYDAQQAIFVLDRAAAWTDRELVERAIDVLSATLGERSPRTALARARYALEFKSNDPAALAGAMMLVGEVLQRTPDSLPALRLMANLFLSGENPDRNAAIRHLQRAVAANPSNAELLPDLIELLQEQGDFTGAESYLRSMGAAARRRPDLQQRELRLLEAQGDYDGIVQRLNDRIEAVNACEIEKLILASSLHRTGRHRQAEMHFEELLSLENPSPAAVAAAANFYATQSRFDDGLALLEGLFDRDPTARNAILVANYHIENGETREAITWLDYAADASPRDTAVILNVAEHALILGEHRRAFEAARAGLAIDPKHDSLRAALVLAGLHLGEAERETASAALEREHWTDAALHETLVLYARVVDREPEAIRQRDLADLRDLVTRHPTSIHAWRLAITTHVQAGQLHEAARLSRLATGRFPTRGEPAEMAMRLLVQIGEPAEALAMARIWRDRSRQRPFQPDVSIARLMCELGRPGEAVSRLEPYVDRILAERDDAPERFELLALALASDGHMERLAAVLRSAMNDDPRWALFGLSLIDRVSDRHAPRLLRLVEPALIESDSNALALAAAWADLARATRHSAHERRAVELADRAARLEHAAVPAALLKASMLEQWGDLSGAAEAYMEAIQREPDNWVALNNLAYVLTAMGQHERAIEMSQRALNARPDDPDLLDTHALALLAAGNSAEARLHAERAVDRRPDDPAMLLTMTRVLVAEERLDEAGAYLERASRAAQHPSRAPRGNEELLRNELRAMQETISFMRSSGQPADP